MLPCWKSASSSIASIVWGTFPLDEWGDLRLRGAALAWNELVSIEGSKCCSDGWGLAKI